jgi:hypothetical protein
MVVCFQTLKVTAESEAQNVFDSLRGWESLLRIYLCWITLGSGRAPLHPQATEPKTVRGWRSLLAILVDASLSLGLCRT